MSKCKPYRPVPRFDGFTEFTPSVPKLYWDVKSSEQRMKALCEQFHKMICYANMLGDKTNENTIDIEELQEQFEKFMESGFDDYYAEQIYQWVIEHMPGIVGTAITMVFFGCSEDGHFTAYIPESWQPIVFNAGYDYSDKNTYGRLILEMYVTDTFQINGKPTDLIWEVVNNG